ncbi:hypothetical protein [Streptomyces sp. NPDC005538]|uniref:hypothetical protein n=1 Tax=unclassified Streptomyces TaxID=2593676 RepID=UPI0033B5FDD6
MTSTSETDESYLLRVFFRSETAQRVKEEVRAAERAQAVVMILERRGLDVPDTLRQHILANRDYEQLGAWLDRAWQITDSHDLLTPA